MAKTILKISNMSRQHCVEKGTDALTARENVQRAKVNLCKGREVVRKTVPLPLSLIGGILLILFSITGCSDTPLGSMLTVDDIDRYVVSNGDGTLCIQDAYDSACMKLVPQGRGGADITNAPIIHIHPEKLVYVFYYKDRPILRAERVMDTTLIVQQLRDTGGVQPRPRASYQGRNQGTGGNNRNTNDNDGNPPNTGNPPNIGDTSDDSNIPGGGNTPGGGNNGGNNGGGNGGNGGGGNGNGGNGDGNGGGGNGGGGNGDKTETTDTPDTTNTPDTTDTPPEEVPPTPLFTPGAIDTHHVHPEDATKKRGWLVWVSYPPSITEDSPDADKPGNTHETSLLVVKVTDSDGNIIEVQGWALAGNWDGTYAAQFFVETDSEEITIEVTGLVYATRTAVFRMTMVGGEMEVEEDAGTDTFQTNPLEPSGNQ